MSYESVNLSLSREDAEVLLGVLRAERHNVAAQAACDEMARQLEEQLNPPELARPD